MREFAKISPQFWVDERGKELKKLGTEAQLIVFYLSTNPHSCMIGIYYLPVVFIGHETGIEINTVIDTIKKLSAINYCSYDEKSEYVWVHDMAFDQLGKDLKPSDNKVKGFQDAYQALPKLPFMNKFLEKYATEFYLDATKLKMTATLEAPSEPLRSKEKEKETEKEKEQEKGKEMTNLAVSKNDTAPVLQTACLSLTHVDQEMVVISIALKNDEAFNVSNSMAEEWQQAYPKINVLQTLHQIKEWNAANPKKRKSEASILRHIDLWFAREQDKAKNNFNSANIKNPNSLFAMNQSIADEWLQQNSVEHEELH